MKTIGKLTVITIAACVMALLFTACSDSSSAPPPPTAASFFTGETIPTIRPTFTPDVSGGPTVTPQPTRVISYRTIPIYDDELNKSWRIDTDRMNFQFTRQVVYSGTTAIQVSPEDEFAAFLVIVDENSTMQLPRENIYGVSFYISGGPNYLGHEDFAIAAQGSNFYHYWLAYDESARVGDGPVFSESLLLYFELNNAIPPNEWVKIEIPINSLAYDPPYEFFTGFYIKNDAGVSDTFYIDQIELIVLEVDGVAPNLEQEVTSAVSAETSGTPQSASVQETPVPDIRLVDTDITSIYDDTLNTPWRISTDRTAFEFAENTAYSGDSSLRITPQDDFAAFLVVTDSEITAPYLRDDVIGFRFQLSGGRQPIDINALGIAVQGSNEQFFWSSEDSSALTEDIPSFSESRLFNFGITEEIPANEWGEVVVYLDDLIFDPTYEYFTGFYIKNDPAFSGPFYIDQIEIITAQKESVDPIIDTELVTPPASDPDA